MNELTRLDGSAAQPKRWPNLRPRNAATLIVIDRAGPSPKVLMGKRHPGHKFMPGKFVFPGGRSEAGDRHMQVASELDPAAAAALASRITRPIGGGGRTLALTAIRETHEETGILVGRPAEIARAARDPGPAWAPFLERSVLPDLSVVAFIGRAITPPGRPRRFDTRFFAVDREAIAGHDDGFVGPDKELVEMVWVEFAAVPDLDLARITSVMLEELGQRIAAGFGHALPVPFYYERHGRFHRETLPRGAGLTSDTDNAVRM